jgi:hypothetical protein
MDCPICRGLERAFETELSEYIEARTSVSFKFCMKLAAHKNVEMERARYALGEHRLVCVSIRVIRLSPQQEVTSGLRRPAV